MKTDLTDKYVMLAGLDEISRWINNGLAETEQPPVPGKDKEDMLAGLDSAIDSLVKTGDIKLRDLPKNELERIAKDSGVEIVPIANVPPSEKEQAYLRILKTAKPRGQEASLSLNLNGEDVQLKLGRAKILNNKCYTFNYNTAVTGKIFSSTTQDNLDKLRLMWGFNHEKAFVTLLYDVGNVYDWSRGVRQPERPRYTFVVTGKRNGKDYAFVRKETDSNAAGQTRIYGPSGNIAASSILYVPNPDAGVHHMGGIDQGRFEPESKLALLAKIGLT